MTGKPNLISTDYFALRDSFLRAAGTANAEIRSFPIKATGPRGEQLFIDTAWLGSKSPSELILHISGTHGVEGFAGSAIQSGLLNRGISALPEGKAVVFVHALNPWGMAHMRRVNESNVDLNRNFLLGDSTYKGAPEGYRLIESFLNPSGPPSKLDLFYPLAALKVLRHGFAALKQAIGGGQYDYPKGIYFGGSTLEESILIFRDFLTSHFSQAKKLFAIEVHTGLGDWGTDVIFWPLPLSNPKSVWLQSHLGEKLTSDAPEDGIGFKTAGDLQSAIPKIIPGADVYWLLQEFGAYNPVRTLRALRNENRYHHSGGNDVTHWSKTTLTEHFSPADADWQGAVQSRGAALFDKVFGLLTSG